MMQIVINITEELFKATVNGLDAKAILDLRLAVKNGTPLSDRRDQRRVQIWMQMNLWLVENTV